MSSAVQFVRTRVPLVPPAGGRVIFYKIFFTVGTLALWRCRSSSRISSCSAAEASVASGPERCAPPRGRAAAPSDRAAPGGKRPCLSGEFPCLIRESPCLIEKVPVLDRKVPSRRDGT